MSYPKNSCLMFVKNNKPQVKTLARKEARTAKWGGVLLNYGDAAHARCRKHLHSKNQQTLHNKAIIFFKEFRRLSSTKFVFQHPVLRINHGVNNDISTVLLSSYNKQNNNKTTQQNRTNTHTHETQDEDQRSTIGANTKTKANCFS